MVNINGKTIADALTDGMNNGLQWLAPFISKDNLPSDVFCTIDLVRLNLLLIEKTYREMQNFFHMFHIK